MGDFERIMVGFDSYGSADPVVIAVTPGGFFNDMLDDGVGTRELLDPIDIPEDGIWAWEGDLVFRKDEWVPDISGTWRQPNTMEWEALKLQRNPWA